MDLYTVLEGVKGNLQYYGTSLGHIELIASAILILNVYLLSRSNIYNYIPGAIGVILFGYIFYESKLYADMMLQLAFFLPMQVIGWAVWMYAGPNRNDDLEIVSLSWPALGLVLIMSGMLAGAFGYYFDNHTEAVAPYWDSAVVALSIVATLIQTRKVLDSWILWIMVDIIAIPLYFSKGLYITSVLYVVFLGLATYGLFTWYNIWRNYEHPLHDNLAETR